MKATSAVNMTVMALLIAPMPAGARSAAQANSANGMTELMVAMPAMMSHRRGVNSARACHRNGSRMSAPRLRRISTSGTGPKSVAATRMNRNEPPQIAPSTASSSMVRHELAGAAADAAVGAVGAGGADGESAVVHSLGMRSF